MGCLLGGDCLAIITACLFVQSRGFGVIEAAVLNALGLADQHVVQVVDLDRAVQLVRIKPDDDLLARITRERWRPVAVAMQVDLSARLARREALGGQKPERPLGSRRRADDRARFRYAGIERFVKASTIAVAAFAPCAGVMFGHLVVYQRNEGV